MKSLIRGLVVAAVLASAGPNVLQAAVQPSAGGPAWLARPAVAHKVAHSSRTPCGCRGQGMLRTDMQSVPHPFFKPGNTHHSLLTQ